MGTERETDGPKIQNHHNHGKAGGTGRVSRGEIYRKKKQRCREGTFTGGDYIRKKVVEWGGVTFFGERGEKGENAERQSNLIGNPIFY